jgi:hypothetical protein
MGSREWGMGNSFLFPHSRFPTPHSQSSPEEPSCRNERRPETMENNHGETKDGAEWMKRSLN